MKAAYYLRAQTFEAPSIKHTKVQFTIKSDEDKACRTNIMFDNRVCRGNTYSNPVITEDQKRNQRVYEREQAARLRHQDILRNRQVRRNCKLCFSSRSSVSRSTTFGTPRSSMETQIVVSLCNSSACSRSCSWRPSQPCPPKP